jgi:DNA mismatch repair protein MutS
VSMSTPLMRQYTRIKAKYPDTVLLFRMGDFYETFDSDAVTTSKVLGITLTKRGNGAAGEVPLAGFPYHALEAYLPKLLKAGYRVAICEQIEDPKLAKGIVKRDVIEVVTPGIAFSEKVLEQKQNNYLAALALPHAIANGKEIIGFAFIDISTGEFFAGEFPFHDAPDQIASIRPSEILVQKRDHDSIKSILLRAFTGKAGIPLLTKIDDWVYNYDYGYELLLTHFKTQSLKGFGSESFHIGIIAAGAVMNYLQETQKSNLSHIQRIRPYETSDFIILDQSTQRNLEITAQLMTGGGEGTLFALLDRTLTPMGGRLLKQWVSRPLKRLDAVIGRLDSVTELYENINMIESIRKILDSIGDLERLTGKICTARANPREVIQLRSILEVLPSLITETGTLRASYTKELVGNLDPLAEVVQEIRQALNDDLPAQLSDGNVIRKGYNTELDELRELAFSGKSWIANLQRKERERTRISSLKVSYNKVFGYYIEITHTHKDKVPQEYIRKQTLTNAERFVTPELKEYEEKILNAEEKILRLESDLFNTLREKIGSYAHTIQLNAMSIASLDVLCSFAYIARKNSYVRPVVNDGYSIEIKAGRHPVIESYLPPGERYIPNDTVLNEDDHQILIITGPNMSGKSSYIRQAGLIVLLAQLGCYVPAERAVIGVVDKIYTRVGASDNIAAGESTFLVEMHEAANIVNTATDRSLILLDEVGRGTSTFDGISIAWALTEYIHERLGAKTIFATHYHELNELAGLFPRIRNYRVDVREYRDKVVFLHKVIPGFADHSYGIQVAQMAGLPSEITERAKLILKNLEDAGLTLRNVDGKKQLTKEDVRRRLREAGEDLQMTLFEVKDDALREMIRSLELEHITPLEALQHLARLKAYIEGKK